MGDTVGVRALQQHASEVVRRAASGEVIEITDRGRPVARIVPLATDPLGSMIDSSVARPARRPVADLPPALPATAGTPLSRILAEQRSTER